MEYLITYLALLLGKFQIILAQAPGGHPHQPGSMSLSRGSWAYCPVPGTSLKVEILTGPVKKDKYEGRWENIIRRKDNRWSRKLVSNG